MFKFGFSADDLEDNSMAEDSTDPTALIDDGGEPVSDLNQGQFARFAELSVDELIASLPPKLSYTTFEVSVSSSRSISIPRRDLFDARFQLISAPDNNYVDQNESSHVESRDHTLQLIDAPSDLIHGVYEGGLKTWECSFDLVACLHGMIREAAGDWVQGKTILEVGCGTAIPSLYLLYELFQLPASAAASTTDFTFQDYNSSVLELMTFPNILLTWYLSPASLSYRNNQAQMQEDDTEPDDLELSITPELTSAFLESLRSRKIHLEFYSGSWAELVRVGEPTNCDLILTSETIYRTSSLPSLVGLLKLRCRTAAQAEENSSGLPAPGKTLCLVAAKVVYFGVGGGVGEFTNVVEASGGQVRSVWEVPSGVARRVMSADWAQ